jgi:hypothetical protein
MRTLFLVTLAVIVLAITVPQGCQRLREHMLLSLLEESARPTEAVAVDPPSFRFPPTGVRVVAVIDYDDARRADGHVSFVPPDGSDLYVWAASVCDSWSPRCMEVAPPATLDAVTVGTLPPGLHQIEPPTGRPRDLVSNHLYGLALFGDKLFALTTFYRDDAGAMHTMEGARFAAAVVRGRRDEIAVFLTPHPPRPSPTPAPAP